MCWPIITRLLWWCPALAPVEICPLHVQSHPHSTARQSPPAIRKLATVSATEVQLSTRSSSHANKNLGRADWSKPGKAPPMAMAVSAAAAALPISAVRSRSSRPFRAALNKHERARAVGNFAHFKDAIRKDFDFMRKGIKRGVEWANESFRVPQAARDMEDLLWLRALERPDEPVVEPSSWPQPSYPGNVLKELLLRVESMKF